MPTLGTIANNDRMVKTVVIAFDFMPHSERAVALALSGYPFGKNQIAVDILHTIDAGADADHERNTRAAIEGFVTAQKRDFTVPYTITLRRGDVVKEIAAHVVEKQAYALLVGGQKHRALSDRLLGRTVLDVLRATNVITYVVKETAQCLDTRGVACAVDLNPKTAHALILASELAKANGRSLKLIHVMDSGVDYPTIDTFVGAVLTQAEHELERFETATLGAPTSSERQIVVGPTASTIVDAVDAKQIGLVVTGSHSWRWHGLPLAGSVGEKIASSSPVDVLVVR